MDPVVIVGALLIIAVIALVSLRYTRVIELTAEVPFIKLAVKGEAKESASEGHDAGTPQPFRPEQHQTDTTDSDQTMPAAAGENQVQRRTKGSSQTLK